MEKCEHKFVYLDTKRLRENAGYNDHFKRIDTFFCEKCLEYIDKVQEGYARGKPDWYL
ncbi:hypothetical protein [Brevibacillus sp. NRS-1366]|uniref:hypothetical protein n=1 Tax=Brevibacillus sp. NRS-1366 TaxID=3233899 RepID=UPI003D236DF2